MKKFKPFSGFCPVPVLPSSQVAATSYMQHLAYVEWYIEQLRKHFEQQDTDFDTAIERIQDSFETVNADIEDLDDRVAELEQSGSKPQILAAIGALGGAPAGGASNVALFNSSESTTTKLSVDNGEILVGAGVSKIRISGGMLVGYTGGGSAIGCAVSVSGGSVLTSGRAFAPLEGTLSSMTVNVIEKVISVTSGTRLTFSINGYSDLVDANTSTSINLSIEVIDE